MLHFEELFATRTDFFCFCSFVTFKCFRLPEAFKRIKRKDRKIRVCETLCFHCIEQKHSDKDAQSSLCTGLNLVFEFHFLFFCNLEHFCYILINVLILLCFLKYLKMCTFSFSFPSAPAESKVYKGNILDLFFL